MGACPVSQPQPCPHGPLLCCMSSLPWLPVSAPPTGLDEYFFNFLAVGLPCSLFFWQYWLFFVFKLVVILLLVVQGREMFLPMPPSWPELPHSSLFHVWPSLINRLGFGRCACVHTCVYSCVHAYAYMCPTQVVVCIHMCTYCVCVYVACCVWKCMCACSYTYISHQIHKMWSVKPLTTFWGAEDPAELIVWCN